MIYRNRKTLTGYVIIPEFNLVHVSKRAPLVKCFCKMKHLSNNYDNNDNNNVYDKNDNSDNDKLIIILIIV